MVNLMLVLAENNQESFLIYNGFLKFSCQDEQ
jgi:hypothetical protein